MFFLGRWWEFNRLRYCRFFWGFFGLEVALLPLLSLFFGFFGLELALLPLLSLLSVSSNWNSPGFLSKCWFWNEFIARIHCLIAFLMVKSLPESIRFASAVCLSCYYFIIDLINRIHWIPFREWIFTTIRRNIFFRWLLLSRNSLFYPLLLPFSFCFPPLI